jgi:hypothetical protein
LIQFVGCQPTRKSGQSNREKSGQLRDLGTVFSTLVSNLLCAQRGGQGRNQTARIAKITHQKSSMLFTWASSAPGNVFDRAFDAANKPGHEQRGGIAFVPFGNTPACQPQQGFL